MAKYTSEMLDFGYTASLCISHPSVRPDEITHMLERAPKLAHAIGDRRMTPKGGLLDGTYDQNYWSMELQTRDGEDLVEFLTRMLDSLDAHRGFLGELVETGGEICCFIGVFCDRCCAHQFERSLMARLADMGFDLRIDFYGSDLPQDGLHTTDGDGTSA